MKISRLVIIFIIGLVLLYAIILCIMFRPYHSINEFDWVVVGETTFADICWFTAQTIAHTSYGGFAEFKTVDGKTIQIIYYGPDLVVGDISVIE